MMDEHTQLVSVKVKTLDGRGFNMKVPVNLKVDAFKARLMAESAVPESSQRLVFQGKVLESGKSLQDYAVRENSNIVLVESLPGSEERALQRDSTTALPSREDEELAAEEEEDDQMPALLGGGSGASGRDAARQNSRLIVIMEITPSTAGTLPAAVAPAAAPAAPAPAAAASSRATPGRTQESRAPQPPPLLPAAADSLRPQQSAAAAAAADGTTTPAASASLSQQRGRARQPQQPSGDSLLPPSSDSSGGGGGGRDNPTALATPAAAPAAPAPGPSPALAADAAAGVQAVLERLLRSHGLVPGAAGAAPAAGTTAGGGTAAGGGAAVDGADAATAAAAAVAGQISISTSSPENIRELLDSLPRSTSPSSMLETIMGRLGSTPILSNYGAGGLAGEGGALDLAASNDRLVEDITRAIAQAAATQQQGQQAAAAAPAGTAAQPQLAGRPPLSDDMLEPLEEPTGMVSPGASPRPSLVPTPPSSSRLSASPSSSSNYEALPAAPQTTSQSLTGGGGEDGRVFSHDRPLAASSAFGPPQPQPQQHPAAAAPFDSSSALSLLESEIAAWEQQHGIEPGGGAAAAARPAQSSGGAGQQSPRSGLSYPRSAGARLSTTPRPERRGGRTAGDEEGRRSGVGGGGDCDGSQGLGGGDRDDEERALEQRLGLVGPNYSHDDDDEGHGEGGGGQHGGRDSPLDECELKALEEELRSIESTLNRREVDLCRRETRLEIAKDVIMRSSAPSSPVTSGRGPAVPAGGGGGGGGGGSMMAPLTLADVDAIDSDMLYHDPALLSPSAAQEQVELKRELIKLKKQLREREEAREEALKKQAEEEEQRHKQSVESCRKEEEEGGGATVTPSAKSNGKEPASSGGAAAASSSTLASTPQQQHRFQPSPPSVPRSSGGGPSSAPGARPGKRSLSFTGAAASQSSAEQKPMALPERRGEADEDVFDESGGGDLNSLSPARHGGGPSQSLMHTPPPRRRSMSFEDCPSPQVMTERLRVLREREQSATASLALDFERALQQQEGFAAAAGGSGQSVLTSSISTRSSLDDSNGNVATAAAHSSPSGGDDVQDDSSSSIDQNINNNNGVGVDNSSTAMPLLAEAMLQFEELLQEREGKALEIRQMLSDSMLGEGKPSPGKPDNQADANSDGKQDDSAEPGAGPRPGGRGWDSARRAHGPSDNGRGGNKRCSIM